MISARGGGHLSDFVETVEGGAGVGVAGEDVAGGGVAGECVAGGGVEGEGVTDGPCPCDITPFCFISAK